MSYRVEITDPAESDAREAVRWIAQYSTDKATLWYFDFLDAADSLQNFPARCSIAPESSETLELRASVIGIAAPVIGMSACLSANSVVYLCVGLLLAFGIRAFVRPG